MDYHRIISEFPQFPKKEELDAILARAGERAKENYTGEVLRKCFCSLDITILQSTDSRKSIGDFVGRVAEFASRYPSIPGVASVCVYPNFVETAGLVLGNSAMSITAVTGGFPSSQTFIEVKMLETAMAVEQGADEVDTVLSIGEFLEEDYDLAGNEIELLRGEIGTETILKVIIESGLLEDARKIYNASIIAMAAGADFIKTSTGKYGPGATPEAAVVICLAIRDYYRMSGRRVGFKAAGGVKGTEAAVMYYSIVEEVLGGEWLTPAFFRIGASSLANDLLGAITGKKENYF